MSFAGRLTGSSGIDRQALPIAVLDAGSFDHPSYLPIKALEDALVARGFGRIDTSSQAERILSRLIIKYDWTRFFVRLTRRVHFVVVMNLPARRFYPQGWWSESITYCFDCWSNRYDEWERFLRRNRVQVAFFSARDAARELSRRLPDRRIIWMPEAIDPRAYSPAKPLHEREIDLLEFGRSWPRYHARITSHCESSGHVHLYPTGGVLLFPKQEDLYHGLANAKFVVCVPQSISHPEIAGTTETMSLRYLEVIASGAIPLGRCPQEMIDLFGYNPVVEIDDANPEAQIDSLLADPAKFTDLRNRNLQKLSEIATWEVRAADIVRELAFDDRRSNIGKSQLPELPPTGIEKGAR